MNKEEYNYLTYILKFWGEGNDIFNFEIYNDYFNECCEVTKKYFNNLQYDKINTEQKIICPKFKYNLKNTNNIYSINSIEEWKKQAALINLFPIKQININQQIFKINKKENHVFQKFHIDNGKSNFHFPEVVKNNKNYLFIGDIHGDLNQFLAPFHIHKIYKNFNYDIYSNSFTWENDVNYNKYSLIFLGDIFHYSVYDDIIANTLLKMLDKQLTWKWILGNHDSLIISYGLLKDKKNFLKIYNYSYFKHIFRSYLPGVQYLFNNNEDMFNKIYPYLNELYHTNDISAKMISAMKQNKICYSCVINNHFVSHASITKEGINEFIMLLKYENSFIKYIKNDFVITNQNSCHLFSSIDNDIINDDTYYKLKKSTSMIYISKILNKLFLNLNGSYFLQKIQLLNVVSPDCLFHSINGHISGIKIINNENSKHNIFNYKSCYNPIQRNINCKLGMLNYNGTLTKYIDFGSSVKDVFENFTYKMLKISQPDYLILENGIFEYSNINKVFCVLTNKKTNEKHIECFNINEFYQNIF